VLVAKGMQKKLDCWRDTTTNLLMLYSYKYNQFSGENVIKNGWQSDGSPATAGKICVRFY